MSVELRRVFERDFRAGRPSKRLRTLAVVQHEPTSPEPHEHAPGHVRRHAKPLGDVGRVGGRRLRYHQPTHHKGRRELVDAVSSLSAPVFSHPAAG
jgi:hypothetical protein